GFELLVERALQQNLIDRARLDEQPLRNRIAEPMHPDGGSRRPMDRLLRPLDDRQLTDPGMIEILFERVNLPQISIGIGDPELRLPGVTAFDAVLATARDAG